MARDNIELMKESTVDRYESVHQLGGINLRLAKKILDKQMDMLGIWVDVGIRQMELIGVMDLHELNNANIRLIRHFTEQLEGERREILKLVGDAKSEYHDWYQSNVAKITAQVNQVSEKAAA